MDLKAYVREKGRPYSEALGIDLSEGDPSYFRWFLASVLYSKPIREETAKRTYKLFEAEGLVSPKAIIKAGWDKLVEVLDGGGYTRYDFSTADRLLEISRSLVEHFSGSLDCICHEAKDEADLEGKLIALGKGIGPLTVSIFLRDMRGAWAKVDPPPTPKVRAAMNALGVSDLDREARLLDVSRGKLETALHRYYNENLRPKPRRKAGSKF